MTVTILNCVAILFGAGKHLSTQSPENAVKMLKLSFAARAAYQCVLGTTKIGLCAFYLRIFSDRRSRLAIYALMAFVGIYTIALEIYALSMCQQHATQFFSGNSFSCNMNSPDVYTSAICNIFG